MTWASLPSSPDVDRIPEQAVARAGAADEVVRNVEHREDAVDARQHQVREHHPEQDRDPDGVPADPQALLEEQHREPDRGEGGEHEEDPVEHLAAGAFALRFVPPSRMRAQASASQYRAAFYDVRLPMSENPVIHYPGRAARQPAPGGHRARDPRPPGRDRGGRDRVGEDDAVAEDPARAGLRVDRHTQPRRIAPGDRGCGRRGTGARTGRVKVGWRGCGSPTRWARTRGSSS